MTVQELIEKLEKVKNKNAKVLLVDNGIYCVAAGIAVEESGNEIVICEDGTLDAFREG